MRHPLTFLLMYITKKRGEKSFRKFEAACDIADEYSEKLLMELVNYGKDTEYGKKYHFDRIHNSSDFKRLVPISEYDDYAPYVNRMVYKGEENLLTSRKIVHYAATSGSVGVPKFIPVVQEVIDLYSDMGCSRLFAVGAKYQKSRGKKFPYYKALNLIEITEMYTDRGVRVGAISSSALARIRRYFKYTATSPDEVIYPKEETDLKYLKLLFALKEENVSFISSAFTSVLADLLAYLTQNWEQLTEDIRTGTISMDVTMSDSLRAALEAKLKPDPKRADKLRAEFEKGFDTPIVPRLWPSLAFVGAIGTGSFEPYTEIVRKHIGEDIGHDNLLYAASESIFAACCEMNSTEFAMIPQSGYYEFVPAESDDLSKTLSISELEVGKEYEIIVTNLSGFYRYRMYDVIKVLGFKGQSPLMRFVYRKNQLVNMVGEKTNTMALAHAVEEFSKEIGCEIVEYSVYPDISDGKSRYCFVIEPEHELDLEKKEEYAQILEDKLGEANMPFLFARQSGELEKSTIIIVQSQTYKLWRDLQIVKGTSPNQVKPVRIIDTPVKKNFFFKLVQ